MAERAYRWPDYEGRVCLFRASEKGLRGRGDAENSREWEIHELAGYDGSIIREPRVRDLAELVNTCLESASSAVLAEQR